MGDIPRVMLHISNPPAYAIGATNQIVENTLATRVHSSQRTILNPIVQTSLGAILVFQRDMTVNVPLIANIYSLIQQRNNNNR